jgi:hypothetical protein
VRGTAVWKTNGLRGASARILRDLQSAPDTHYLEDS